MKKLLISCLLLLALFVVACSNDSSSNSSSNSDGADSNNGGGATVELILGTWFPPGETVVAEVTNPWTKLINEETNGEVFIEEIHGSQLGTASTVYQDVAGGVYDIGWASPILHNDTELFPFTIANLPFALTDPEKGAKVMRKFFEKYADPQELEYLGITASDPYVIWSKNPIESVEDLKGLKIRAASTEQIEIMKNLGAVPVDVALIDMYEALQKGTIDASVFAITGGVSYKLVEVAPYMTKLPISAIALLPVINSDALSKISEDSKNKILEHGQHFANLYTQNTVNNVDDILANRIPDMNGTVIELSEEQQNEFKVGVKEIWDNWVNIANQKGYPGEEMMEDFKKFLVEEGLSVPF